MSRGIRQCRWASPQGPGDGVLNCAYEEGHEPWPHADCYQVHSANPQPPTFNPDREWWPEWAWREVLQEMRARFAARHRAAARKDGGR